MLFFGVTPCVGVWIEIEVRDCLERISQARQQSISEIVSQYALQEDKKLNRKQSREQTKGEKA